MLPQTHAPGLTAMLTSGTEEGQQCGALAIANIAANDSQNIFEIGESFRGLPLIRHFTACLS